MAYVEPKNTSKECSRRGSIGAREEKRREEKEFVCQRGY
ncbi:MAG: zinc ribbon domain-containing protein [Nitrososphaerota archaeon]